MPSRRRQQKTVDGPALEAVMGAVLALAPAYFLAEGILRVYPHVIHWVGMGLGIAGGYGLGALVAAYKEARPPFGRGLSRAGRIAPTSTEGPKCPRSFRSAAARFLLPRTTGLSTPRCTSHRASVAEQGTRVRVRPGGRGDQSEATRRRTGR